MQTGGQWPILKSFLYLLLYSQTKTIGTAA